MRKGIAISLVLALCAAFAGCNSGRGIKVTEQNKDTVLDDIKASKAFR